MTNDRAIMSFVSGCLGKISFLSMWKAKKAAERVYRKSGIQLYSYSCPHCGCVHLTSQKYGRSHFKYRAYKCPKTLWEKERELNLRHIAIETD